MDDSPESAAETGYTTHGDDSHNDDVNNPYSDKKVHSLNHISLPATVQARRMYLSADSAATSSSVDCGSLLHKRFQYCN